MSYYVNALTSSVNSGLSYVSSSLSSLAAPYVAPIQHAINCKLFPEDTLLRNRIIYVQQLNALEEVVAKFKETTLPSLEQGKATTDKINGELLSVIEKAEINQIVKERIIATTKSYERTHRQFFGEFCSKFSELVPSAITDEKDSVRSGIHDSFILNTYFKV